MHHPVKAASPSFGHSICQTARTGMRFHCPASRLPVSGCGELRRIIHRIERLKPPGYLIQCFPLLVALLGEPLEEPCAWRMLRDHRQALPNPIAAMRDERHQRLPRQFVTGKKGPDHRRRRHSPDGKSEENHLIRADFRIPLLERRFVARVPLSLGLADRRFIVFRICFSGLDLERSAPRARLIWRAMTRVFPFGKIGDQTANSRSLLCAEAWAERPLQPPSTAGGARSSARRGETCPSSNIVS